MIGLRYLFVERGCRGSLGGLNHNVIGTYFDMVLVCINVHFREYLFDFLRNFT